MNYSFFMSNIFSCHFFLLLSIIFLSLTSLMIRKCFFFTAMQLTLGHILSTVDVKSQFVYLDFFFLLEFLLRVLLRLRVRNHFKLNAIFRSASHVAFRIQPRSSLLLYRFRAVCHSFFSISLFVLCIDLLKSSNSSCFFRPR